MLEKKHWSLHPRSLLHVSVHFLMDEALYEALTVVSSRAVHEASSMIQCIIGSKSIICLYNGWILGYQIGATIASKLDLSR